MVSMSTTWDRTTALLGAHRGDIVAITLLGIALPSAAGAIVEPLGNDPDSTTRILVGIASVAALLMTLWGQLGITALALSEGGGVPRAMATASARFLPLLLATLVVVVVALLLTAPFFVIFAAAGADFAQFSTPGYSPPVGPASALFILVYFVVWVPLMLFFAAKIMLMTPVVVAEHQSIGAIPRSFELTRGITLKIIGVLILYIVIILVATVAATTVFGAITRLLLPAEGAVSAASVVAAILVAVVTAAFSVLSTVFVAELYKAVRGGAQARVDLNKGI